MIMVLKLFTLYYSIFISILLVDIYKEILFLSCDVLNVVIGKFYPIR